MDELFEKHLICFANCDAFHRECHERREVRNYHRKELLILQLSCEKVNRKKTTYKSGKHETGGDVEKDSTACLGPPISRCREGLALTKSMSLSCSGDAPSLVGLYQAVVKHIELPILFLLLKMRKNSIFLSCQIFWPCRRHECVHSQGLGACTISPAQLVCLSAVKARSICYFVVLRVL